MAIAKRKVRTGRPRLGASSDSPPESRGPELAWIEAHRKLLLGQVGQWIVLDGEELLAVNPDLQVAVTEAAKKGGRNLFVYRVPKDIEDPIAV